MRTGSSLDSGRPRATQLTFDAATSRSTYALHQRMEVNVTVRRTQHLNAPLAACAMALGLGGCEMLPNLCYQEPRDVFAPHPADEWPVFDEPAWTLERPNNSSITTRVVLPFEYDSHAYYAIEQGDEAVFRLRLILGQHARTADEVIVACFVEGRGVAIDVGGPLADSSTVLLRNGVAARDIRLTPDQLQPGLNQVDVFALYLEESGQWELAANSFTIANGSLTPQQYLETPLEPSDAPRDARVATLSDPLTGEPLQRVWSRRGDVDVTLNLRPAVSDAFCEGGFDRFAVVALRDGVPTPIEGFDRIVTTLREGEQRRIRYRLPLWDDDAQHSYFVLALSGLGRASGNYSFVTREGGPLLSLGWNGAF